MPLGKTLGSLLHWLGCHFPRNASATPPQPAEKRQRYIYKATVDIHPTTVPVVNVSVVYLGSQWYLPNAVIRTKVPEACVPR